MNHPSQRLAALAAVAGLLVAASGLSTAQDAKSRPDEKGPGTPTKGPQRVAGVIVKIEDGARDDGESKGESKKDRRAARGRRLTINTAVVWRDWVRDQVPAK